MKQLLPNANGGVETQPVTQNSPDTQEFTEMFDSRLPLKLCSIYLNGLENHRKLLLDVKSPNKCEIISCQCGWNEDDGDMVLLDSTFFHQYANRFKDTMPILWKLATRHMLRLHL